MKKIFKNILVIRTDRMGDVVLTTPVFKALRENFPQANISVLVAPALRDIVEGNPFINEIILDERKGKHHGFFGFWTLVHEIKKRRFDAAIVLHTKKRTYSLCFLAGIPNRIGYNHHKAIDLLTDKIEDRRFTGEKHETEFCLDVLRFMGLKVEKPEIYLPFHDDAERWAQELCLQNHFHKEKLIAIHPAASDSSKCWEPQKFAELIDLIARLYKTDFVIIGSAAASEAAETIRSFLPKGWPHIIDLTGKTSIRQLISLFRQCRLLISADSGPVHMADGVGTSVVSIFTRNQPGINATRWRPLNPLSKAVSAPFDTEISYKKAGSFPAVHSNKIPVSSVLEAVDSIFKLC